MARRTLNKCGKIEAGGGGDMTLGFTVDTVRSHSCSHLGSEDTERCVLGEYLPTFRSTIAPLILPLNFRKLQIFETSVSIGTVPHLTEHRFTPPCVNIYAAPYISYLCNPHNLSPFLLPLQSYSECRVTLMTPNEEQVKVTNITITYTNNVISIDRQCKLKARSENAGHISTLPWNF